MQPIEACPSIANVYDKPPYIIYGTQLRNICTLRNMYIDNNNF